jgi:nicotinate-nucleotide pyrophosphorylase (carboxylating)
MSEPEFEDAVRAIVRLALAEDLGAGDATSLAVVPATARARGTIRARQEGVLSGVAAAREVFREIDAGLAFASALDDGAPLAPGVEVLRVSGGARAVLAGERVALNFLQRLSGVATLTARFVAAVAGTGVRILDTRKTTPGMRRLEKAAVRHGGGSNHRLGLFDAILVKENHVAAAGGLAAALDRARAAARGSAPPLPIVCEAHSFADVTSLVGAGVDRVLLDNFTPSGIARAVRILRGGPAVEIEVSGGITLENVRAHALPGVDFISVGALTHSAPACDLSLDLELEP